MRNRIFSTLIGLLISTSCLANWTNFVEVGQLQSYGDGLQVWLKDTNCPNSKPYFSISDNYTTKLDMFVSMILVAKTSGSKVKIQYNTTDDAKFCHVTGIQVE